jgi:hypothetical protein
MSKKKNSAMKTLKKITHGDKEGKKAQVLKQGIKRLLCNPFNPAFAGQGLSDQLCYLQSELS